MRIALDVSAVPARPAGAGTYIVELVRALARIGSIDLDLVAANSDALRWRQAAPNARVRDVVPRSRPARLVWEQVRAPAYAKQVRAAVWHSPHYTMPLRSPLPVVVTAHDATFFDHPEWHERAKVLYFRHMLQLSARRAQVLVCVSEHTANRVRALLEPRADVVVIPHGVDHDRFRAHQPDGDDADLALLASHGVRSPFVAFVGTLEPRKNVPALVRAFDQLADRQDDLTLVIAGQSGWGAREVERAVGAARHRDRIVRPGYVAAPVVPALLRRATAVAYPSLEEGFGLPALEALACGAPLVTTTGSAMEEVAGDAALLVPPGDVDALTGALGRLLDDEELRQELRTAGPSVAAPYTWTRCAEQHAVVYAGAA